MPSNRHAGRQASVVVDITDDVTLSDTSADVKTDPMSYYKRNSGLLPRLSDAASGTYELGALPKPVDPGPDSLMERLRGLVGASRVSRRPPR